MKKTTLFAALAAATVLTRNAPAHAADTDERRQPMSGFQGERLMAFAPNSYNADARSVEAVLSTGAEVKRYYFSEQLEVSPEAVDLARAMAGQVKLLDSHNKYEADAVVGTVSNVRVENGQLLGTLNFGETDRAKKIEGMVARGELTGVSIGYRVNTWEVRLVDEGGHETWCATRWELLEVSLVSVPADANAGVRSNGGDYAPGAGDVAANQEEDDMKRNLPAGASAGAIAAATAAAPAAAPAVEPTRAAEPAAPPTAAPAAAPAADVTRFSAVDAVAFVDQARAFGDVAITRANELVQQNGRGEVSVEQARSTLLQVAAEAQRAQTAPARTAAVVTADERDASRAAVADAIVARALRQSPSDASREFMGLRLIEIAAQRAGIDMRSQRDPDIIMRAAMTSSDFPLLLEAAANKIMLARYTNANPTYQAIAARRDLTDFKTTKLLRVGDFPTLQAYAEDGEIKTGTINEGRETVVLGSYGRIIRLTRQAIVNDDLGAFDEVLAGIGGVVSRFENATFFAMKALNSGNGPKLADNVNFFNASHGNLAGAGGAVDVTTLGAGRAAMRKQKDLDGNALNIAPAIILNGPDTETGIEQFLAPIVAAEGAKVNPFASKLMQVTEASITGNGWELYADPSVLPAFNYGYLRDAPGPKVMTKEGFDHDGVAFRVTEDFYAGAVDYRAGYRNPGA